jgi:hypothetical protein
LRPSCRGRPPPPQTYGTSATGTYRPKDEEAFSDYVKRHLEGDLGRRGVVVNREVVIRRGEGAGRGERTDIHVDAVVRGPGAEEHRTVTVIVEVKGSWYQRLYHAMQAQLVERYLRDNESQHGLYLVGWFNCPQWDDTDRRKATAIRRDLEETRERLEAKAAELSEGELRIKPLIINTALR